MTKTSLIIETDSNLYAHRSPPLPSVQATSGTALVAKRAKHASTSRRLQCIEIRNGGGQRRSAARAPAMADRGFAHRPRCNRDRHLRQDAHGDRSDRED